MGTVIVNNSGLPKQSYKMDKGCYQYRGVRTVKPDIDTAPEPCHMFHVHPETDESWGCYPLTMNEIAGYPELQMNDEVLVVD